MLTRLRSQRGFTLVELLIVVAIIGVLATIGVPTYRKMVQKAKKSEAKVGLGALFTANSAFFAEYGAYGNNINKIGFEMEGNRQLYSIGFPAASCANQTTVLPTAASAPGVGINTSFGQYYDTTTAGSFITVMGRTVGGSANCLAGTVANPDGATYTATATGAIAPGFTAASALTDQDQWTMTNARVLSNTVDGVK